MINPNQTNQILFKLRIAIAVFIFCLVVSGLTAFPLLTEIRLLIEIFDIENNPNNLSSWILHVEEGLSAIYEKYPWVGYGTDWLAFGHIIIGLFFIGVFIDPVRNIWIIKAGIIACILVIPQALISGSIREIPFGWRLIDCSFGVFGILPLIYSLSLAKKL